ncbi:Riboflavin biosynthesis protein RibD [compost metagenome]
MTDAPYMQRALDLARRGRGWVNPNPLVGAVVVRDGEIVGEGFHPQIGEPHAEVFALREAGEKARGATIYVTLEPCNHWGRTPPCTQAIIDAGIQRVVAASWDANPLTAEQSRKTLEAAGITLTVGVLEAEALRLNEPFFHFMRTRRPFVAMKTAMTLDGKIATPTGHSQWISGETSREHVQELRATYAGIMAGIGTVLADDPSLTCRIPGAHPPARIIVDPRAETPPSAKLFADPSPVILAIAPGIAPERRNALEAAGAQLLEVPLAENGRHLDLDVLMALLGERGIDSILLEGGGGLNASALRAGIVSKVVTFVAPKLLAGDGIPPTHGPAFATMDQALRLRDLTCHPSGEDLRLEAYVESIRDLR